MAMKLKSSNQMQIFLRALLIRLVMLAIILIVDNGMEKAFMGATTYFDDYRYELGGEAYAVTAKSLVDIDAFVKAYASVGDWVGYHFLENPLEASPLWYWIVSILFYITRSYISVRIFNVIISSIAVVYVYKFADLVYGKRIAVKATTLLTFMPYPVVFSCFGYKDSLIMLVTFYLLYCAVKYRKSHSLKVSEVILILLGSICLLFIRGGLSALLILICLVIAFGDVIRGKLNRKTFIAGIFLIIIAVVFFIKSYSTCLLYTS
ncbi:glycosyltransferase family 39 protein, partial [Erysipelotrichaceae bacterium RD49]|nr:glycosyltransferase family 39 protein [Erysipelotrichaceae bacterium RD49]